MLKVAFYKSRKRIGAKAYCVDTRSILRGGQQKYFDTKENAQRFIDRLSKELVVDDTDAWSWDFEKLRDAYFTHLQKELRDGERTKSYVLEKERHVNAFIAMQINGECLAKISVSGLTRGQIELQLMDQMKQDHAKKTVINYVGSIKKFMSFGVICGCRETNPFVVGGSVQIKGDPAKAKRKTKVRRIQPDIIDQIIAEMTPDWQLIASFAASTGIRQGELRALTWGDILWDQRRVNIDKAYKHKAPVGNTKTVAGERQIPFSKSLKTILMEHYIASGRPQNDVLVFSITEQPVVKVVRNQHGKYGTMSYQYRDAPGRPCALKKGSALTETHFRKIITRACADAGVERITWQELRHFYASMMLRKYSNDVWKVSKRLGHEQKSTTENVYGHWIELDKDRDEEEDDVITIRRKG